MTDLGLNITVKTFEKKALGDTFHPMLLSLNTIAHVSL